MRLSMGFIDCPVVRGNKHTRQAMDLTHACEMTSGRKTKDAFVRQMQSPKCNQSHVRETETCTTAIVLKRICRAKLSKSLTHYSGLEQAPSRQASLAVSLDGHARCNEANLPTEARANRTCRPPARYNCHCCHCWAHEPRSKRPPLVPVTDCQ
jgi:hypothetical protein